MAIKVIMSPTARSELDETADYIANHLHNPAAASKLIRELRKAVLGLGSFPKMGTPLNAQDSATDYRYLLCGSYMVFYHLEGESVHVDRILYGRRDYLALLYGDALAADDSEPIGD